MLKFRHQFLIFLLFACNAIAAQNKSNWGREFWLGYGFNYSFSNETPANGQELQLYISASQPANVTVSINSTGWTRTFAIPANTVDFSVIIPKTGPEDARITGEGLFKKGIQIKSDVPVAVYAHQYNTMVSGATMLMPVETYGYTYYSVNYTQTQSGSNPPGSYSTTVQNGPEWYSWFFVVAPEDSTKIVITPSDTTRLGWLPGQSYTITLNKGEMYSVMGKLGSGSLLYQASKDMTGSKVVSVPGGDGNCHPIALFSGSGGIRLCRGDGGEYMGQQIFPSQAWGTRYLTYHMISNTQTDVKAPFMNFYRVCVLDSTTVVKRNGVVITGLVKNFYYEFNSKTGDYIEADKPIMVAQFTPNANECATMNTVSYGDPEMIYLSPIEQGQKSVLFYTTRKSFIDYVYLSIYIPTAGLASLKLNGAAIPPENIIPHPNLPGYAVAVGRIVGPAAQHTVSSDSSFNATVYGIGLFESYGYNAGTLLNNLDAYASIKNRYSNQAVADSSTCVGTEFNPSIRVAYKLSSIKWRLSAVQELNITKDSTVNAPVPVAVTKIFGRNYYTYSYGQYLKFSTTGQFKIPVTYFADDIDKCDQKRDTVIIVNVKNGPRADFALPAVSCIGKTISLTGSNTMAGFNIVGYKWEFPDNSQLTTKDVSRVFQTGGDKLIRFTVVADNGCSADTLKKLFVSDPSSLTFSISGKACVDSSLSFTSSIPSGQGVSATWYWDFGDGQTSSSKSTYIGAHRYKVARSNIPVKHWVVIDQGCNSDTTTKNVPIINPPPVADMTIAADSFCIGSLIGFQPNNLSNISTWKLDLGDGNQVSKPSPYRHRYSSSKTYTASLVVTSKEGCGSAPFNKSVIIHPPPPINAGTDKYIKKGNAVTLDASISNPSAYSFLWTPALYLDKPNTQNPICKPDANITYQIFVVNNQTLCSASDTVKVFLLSDVDIPNTFTPNGDGINDTWDIRFLDQYRNTQLEIYNTAGQIIFRSYGYRAAWDGKRNGAKMPDGTYYYVIDLGDGSKRLTGYVTILR